MAILFDLDGTLVDTAPDFRETLNRLRLDIHLPPLSEQDYPSIRVAVTEGVEGLLKAGLTITREHPDYGFFQQRLLDTYEALSGEYATLFPGILPLLDTLENHHIPFGIVTNKIQRYTTPLVKRLGLYRRAAVIVSGDTTPFSKPHPEPLLHAARELNLSPTVCAYIGDAKRDIIAGKAASMATVVALFGYIDNQETTNDWQADFRVSHPNEIFPWFQTWQQTKR